MALYMVLAAKITVMIELSFYWLGVAVFTVVGIFGCIFGLTLLAFFILRRIAEHLCASFYIVSFLKHRKYYKEFEREKSNYYEWKNYHSRKADCS